ncbi:MAG: hypothetical protein HKM07_05610 [Chlamydiae bacterium]|nr:hypothetical protein [Chlamydiota bacterium]
MSERSQGTKGESSPSAAKSKWNVSAQTCVQLLWLFVVIPWRQPGTELVYKIPVDRLVAAK